MNKQSGKLSEWFKVTALKAVDGEPSVSSNLTLSALLVFSVIAYAKFKADG